MKITEDKKMIAEFMGYEWYKINEPYIAVRDLNGSLVQFHSDWNALMQVVEKIEDLNYCIEINKQEEKDYQCLIIKKDIKVQTFSKIKIEAVYNACVEFIKLYNEEKK